MSASPMSPLNKEIIPVVIYADSGGASRAVARRIAEVIRRRNAEGKPAVLGLATGHTPIQVYRELIRMHREEGLDFSRVVTFNLDEYWPIDPTAMQSYHRWMRENLFAHVNIPPQNVHIPSGTLGESDIPAWCEQYERDIVDAGGIDLQIVGVGRTGHVGFNEPGSPRDSRTRRVYLDKVTRMDAASDFFGEEYAPRMAVTMGVGTILSAREIAVLAFGEHKAPVVRAAVEGPVTIDSPVTFLQEHPAVTMYLDEAAAEHLTRLQTPWLSGSCAWDDTLRRQAVLWLAQKLRKPILKLTDEDYAEHGLTELLRDAGGSYRLNIAIFRGMMNTITGWPGGKETRKRVLILSPHPDDDVICMAGTMMRFVEQGHEVHTAYMVSGYLSVFDHDVSRYGVFVKDFAEIFRIDPDHMRQVDRQIEEFLAAKNPGESDAPQIRAIKGLIRRAEAIDAARYCGLPNRNIHFLDLPFYDTGTVQKTQIGEGDISAVRKLFESVRPDMIFAAGDMSDPHGTHRLAFQAAMAALEQYVAGGADRPELWLYRGAWQEWHPHQIDMAVPLAPDELRRKRYAIFRHQSQKDRAMFPGPYDSREFWQRAEDRNKGMAELYDLIGLPEYHALEAFVRWPLERTAQAAAQLAK